MPVMDASVRLPLIDVSMYMVGDGWVNVGGCEWMKVDRKMWLSVDKDTIVQHQRGWRIWYSLGLEQTLEHDPFSCRGCLPCRRLMLAWAFRGE